MDYLGMKLLKICDSSHNHIIQLFMSHSLSETLRYSTINDILIHIHYVWIDGLNKKHRDFAM